jgi:hypothetical protein
VCWSQETLCRLVRLGNDDQRTRVRANREETRVPSEEMRKAARNWLYNLDHPNECASQQEVDDLATLLDHVRASAMEDAAKVCDSVHSDPTVGAYTGAEHCAKRIRRVAGAP